MASLARYVYLRMTAFYTEIRNSCDSVSLQSDINKLQMANVFQCFQMLHIKPASIVNLHHLLEITLLVIP